MLTPRKKNRLNQMGCVGTMLAVLVLGGCVPAPGSAVPVQVDGEDAIPSRPPTAEQIRASTAPAYRSPPGVLQECFGRLIFDVKHPIQWPTFYNAHTISLFDRSFSKDVADPGDQMRVGNTRVAVIAAGDDTKEILFKSLPIAREAHLKSRIEEKRKLIADRKVRGVKTQQDRWLLYLDENAVNGWGERIRKIQADFEPFVPGVADSEGYWTSRVNASNDRYAEIRAYVTRGDFIFVFESAQKIVTPADKEAHKQDFSALLARFRTRAPHEIPTELGVCVPFGFIPDDGKAVTEFKQTLRFTDAPGVLYTLQTGNVHPRRLKLPPLTALARASLNPPASRGKGETQAVVAQRIGPRSHKIGALTGEQGGVVWKATRPNGEKHDIYSVFTGYSGWLGTAVLPYILVDMRTVTKDHAAELKQNPPPFEQSMERLELLLKSTRLRPTNPPMPELVNH